MEYDHKSASIIADILREFRQIPFTDKVYRDGSIVRFTQDGQEKIAKVTCIYPMMEPPRWDGVLMPADALQPTHDKYPDEGGLRIWAFESAIVAICQV